MAYAGIPTTKYKKTNQNIAHSSVDTEKSKSRSKISNAHERNVDTEKPRVSKLPKNSKLIHNTTKTDTGTTNNNAGINSKNIYIPSPIIDINSIKSFNSQNLLLVLKGMFQS